MAGLGLKRFRVLHILLRGWPPPPSRKVSICKCSISFSTSGDPPPPPAPLAIVSIAPLRPTLSVMEWTCSRCTLLNSAGDACAVCEQPRKEEAASEMPGLDSWNCPACTFLSPGSMPRCGMCDTEKPLDQDPPVVAKEITAKEEEVILEPSSKRQRVDEPQPSSEEEEGQAAAPVNPGQSSNALLRELHMERMSRKNSIASSAGVSTSSTSKNIVSDSIVFMTYNVWFREDLELERRMEAIGELIRQHQPHVICFQEVTTSIYAIFQRSNWWSGYRCSVSSELAAKRAYFCLQLSKLPIDKFYRNPFHNTIMGRELCLADIDCGNSTQLVVATTHLESPCPAPPKFDQMFSAERVAQMKEALATLKPLPNVVFGGDMNWDDKLDGQPPLENGWMDAWTQLRAKEPGLTYDAKANPMLTGSRLQKRLDRVFYHFRDFEVESIEMIGTKPIPGLTFEKETKKSLLKLPVLPSDHFGLVLKIRKK
ncbi:uncharacterized protein LOC9661184 [Selaginella moellendorffii]|nr:uncharacterized protein LOC9661184 [Selaginella moellendorffii]|eukprot:XP_002962993.2 uncharacterized protein LOC9661184 [Selaginella moellendorffii]